MTPPTAEALESLADRARHEVNADLTQALWRFRVIRTRVISQGGYWGDAIWSYPPDSEECFEERWGDEGGCFMSWPPQEIRPWVWSWKGMRILHERLMREDYMKIRLTSSHYHGDHASITPADETQQRIPMRDALGVWGPDLPSALALAAHHACGFELRADWREAILSCGSEE